MNYKDYNVFIVSCFKIIYFAAGKFSAGAEADKMAVLGLFQSVPVTLQKE
jgi:hypothetical protein